MKVKLKEFLKLAVVLFGFALIYSALTIVDTEWYQEKVSEMKSEYRELDVKLLEFTEDVLSDTSYVVKLKGIDEDSLRKSISAYIAGNDTLIYKFTYSHFKDSSVTDLYLVNLYGIEEEHKEIVSTMEDYVVYHNRLVTRFPSNLIVGSNQLITNK
jgi:hypothetical protein